MHVNEDKQDKAESLQQIPEFISPFVSPEHVAPAPAPEPTPASVHPPAPVPVAPSYACLESVPNNGSVIYIYISSVSSNLVV